MIRSLFVVLSACVFFVGIDVVRAEGRCRPGFFPVGDIRTFYGCAPIPGYEPNVPQPSASRDPVPRTL